MRGSGMPGGTLAPVMVHMVCAIATLELIKRTSTSVTVSWLSLNTKAKPVASLRSISSRPFHHQPTILTTRSEEHTSELQSLMRISYAVFCLKKKKQKNTINTSPKNNQTPEYLYIQSTKNTDNNK